MRRITEIVAAELIIAIVLLFVVLVGKGIQHLQETHDLSNHSEIPADTSDWRATK